MNGWQRAVDLVSKGPTTGRARAASLIAQLVRDCEQASAVWQGYLAKPGPAGDQWSIVSWVGAARAKELYDIHLGARERVLAIAALAGPEFGRFADLEADPIELAYRQLNPGETGPDAARAALERLAARRADLVRQLKRLGSAARAKPAAPARKKSVKRPKPRAKAKRAAPRAAARPKAGKKKAPKKK
jgi:hypothetical protein